MGSHAKIRLDGFDEQDRERIKALACRFVEGQIERQEIECSDEAIRAAMPQALRDARDAVAAATEFLCG